MKNNRHKSPSRARYELKHPVISIRITRELQKKLIDLQATSGKSLGDILREAVGLQAPTAKESFDKGFEIAEDMYKIVFKCSVCGGNEEVFGQIEKEAAARCLTEAGWGHYKCLSKM
ncbi:hypothetical protein ACFLV5_00870 [Chloroflexota bacterium]